jgi:hypothetical protein
MTAEDQRALGIVDLVVAEPDDGAHNDPAETARRLKAVIGAQLAALGELPIHELLERRYQRYRSMGAYTEVSAPPVAQPERPGLADRFRNLLDPGRWSVGVPLPQGRGREEPPAREEV